MPNLLELLNHPVTIAVATLLTIITGSWFFYEKYTKRQRQKSISKPNLCGKTISMNIKECPEGEMPLTSPLYVERSDIETNCYAAIQEPNALILIKAPRQMGKSSLIKRIVNHAKCHNASIVELNLQETDEAIIQNLDKLLQWFTGRIAHSLGVTFNPSEDWDTELYGSKTSSLDYMEQKILPNIPQESFLVIAVDEIDRVFEYEAVAKDFLGMLRAWHEHGKNNKQWQKLRLILAHSQEVYIKLNIHESPFNVGLPFQLPPFDFDQAKDLMQRYGLTWSDEELRKVKQFIGGHPYLLQMTFYAALKGQFDPKYFLKEQDNKLISDQGIYGKHLSGHLNRIQQSGLADTMKQIVQSHYPISIKTLITFKLRSLGLITLVEHDEVTPACELYRRYFAKKL